jgi:DNA modification methylase
MTPYYEEAGIVIYHGDCREVLSALPLSQTVVIADPPYDAQTHAGARSLGLESRKRASDGHRGIAAVGIIDIDFDPADVAFTGTLWNYAARWCRGFRMSTPRDESGYRI